MDAHIIGSGGVGDYSQCCNPRRIDGGGGAGHSIGTADGDVRRPESAPATAATCIPPRLRFERRSSSPRRSRGPVAFGRVVVFVVALSALFVALTTPSRSSPPRGYGCVVTASPDDGSYDRGDDVFVDVERPDDEKKRGDDRGPRKSRIAVVGGGVAGSFAAMYLAEYDVRHGASGSGGGASSCVLGEIAVFDVSPPPPGFEEDEALTATPSSSSVDSITNSKSGTGVLSSADPILPPSSDSDDVWQGSRVSSVLLSDGATRVELGGSVVYDGNRLVVEMMERDPERLKKTEPLGTGRKKEEGGDATSTSTSTPPNGSSSAPSRPRGFAIYDGDGRWALNISRYSSSWVRALSILWRYGLDLWRMRQATHRAVNSFELIYDLLNDEEREATYVSSPVEAWDALGLGGAAMVSYSDLLDGLGLTKEQEDGESGIVRKWWQSWLPGQCAGCLRRELLTGVTINTYNQNLHQMNGLSGLISYIPMSGEIFSIEGGNHLLIESALHQARELYETSPCLKGGSNGDDDNDNEDGNSNDKSGKSKVRRLQKRVTTIVSDDTTMELWSGAEFLGEYDVVILAAPLQMCRINFLVRSRMDPLVLHPMPLGGMHENEERENDGGEYNNNEHGDLTFAASLPSSATAPYTSVVTTVVSNATLNRNHFGLSEAQALPRSILVSSKGKETEGINTLTVLDLDAGLYKLFSSDVLSDAKLTLMFGPDRVVEYVQIWGGRHGGATPNFGGGTRTPSLPYLLYEGSNAGDSGAGGGAVSGKGTGRRGAAAALYYVNAIESAAAAIEISAIGSKSVAKLVARQLGLLVPGQTKDRDEL